MTTSFKFAAFGCKLIQVRGSFIPVHILTFTIIFGGVYFCQFYRLVIDPGRKFLRFLSDVDTQFRPFSFKPSKFPAVG